MVEAPGEFYEDFFRQALMNIWRKVTTVSGPSSPKIKKRAKGLRSKSPWVIVNSLLLIGKKGEVNEWLLRQMPAITQNEASGLKTLHELLR